MHCAFFSYSLFPFLCDSRNIKGQTTWVSNYLLQFCKTFSFITHICSPFNCMTYFLIFQYLIMFRIKFQQWISRKFFLNHSPINRTLRKSRWLFFPTVRINFKRLNVKNNSYTQCNIQIVVTAIMFCSFNLPFNMKRAQVPWMLEASYSTGWWGIGGMQGGCWMSFYTVKVYLGLIPRML